MAAEAEASREARAKVCASVSGGLIYVYNRIHWTALNAGIDFVQIILLLQDSTHDLWDNVQEKLLLLSHVNIDFIMDGINDVASVRMYH